MPYPKHIEQKLEFDQIKQLLINKCISEVGEEYVGKMRFANRFDIVEKMLFQTQEFKRILTEDNPFPAEHYYNIQPFLRKAAIEGTFLVEDELHQIRLLMQTFATICKYFEERNDKYPHAAALFAGIVYNQQVVKYIERILDNEGLLKPNASPELSKISAKIQDREKEVRKRMSQIFDKAQAQGWLANSGITVRDGRLVLPVLAEHKRQISGLVHDESATGQTVYLEPAEIFETNNIIRELQIHYKRERERILIEVTDKLRPILPELEKYLQRMGIIDFIRAKALLAIELDADMPILSKHIVVNLVDAYHPLLKLSHQKQGLPVIPLSLNLNRDGRILVISGPNAGGKSVALKTIGLVQYMLQCGLLVPCKSHSQMSVFNDLMVDIGDEQSIENDLSTYSSHLKHMKYFTEFADAKTLFLIDEFGTGTDPQFGGPLAEAILNRLNIKQAFGVVNTHYSNLKNFAGNAKGLINARMLFDQEQLQPLYKLEIGQPGSSYAFEIAQKTGLNDAIISYARNKVGDKQKRLDDLLIELEREKNHVNELKKRFEEKDIKTKQLMEEYEKLKTDIETNQKQLINKAKQEALAIISEANSRIENTIREIREKKADTDTIRKVRSEIKQEVDQLKQDTTVHQETAPKKVIKTTNANLPLIIGATVRLDGQIVDGHVIELKKNKVLVGFGDLQSWVDVNKLEVMPASTKKVVKQSLTSFDLNGRMQNFKTELNLIGTRGEEAIKKLQEYIDDAYLLGFKDVRIVHGKGYGILRKMVREYLKKCKQVEYVTDEHIELGGDGVSLVTLRV
jgi:DNA mismatch repair protein MutS2